MRLYRYETGSGLQGECYEGELASVIAALGTKEPMIIEPLCATEQADIESARLAKGDGLMQLYASLLGHQPQ